MEIVHIAAEMAPIAKVGGLGDVLHGLSRASSGKDAKVEVILPFYGTLEKNEIKDLKIFMKELTFDFEKKKCPPTKVWKGKVDGIDVTFIDCEKYFARSGVYGFEDDPIRFAFFCKAALEYLLQNKRAPHILHIHDWHASLVAPLVRKNYPFTAKIILTIHNLFYQGRTSSDLLDKIDLKREENLSDPQESKDINLLKAGIAYSDFVTTVSPGYAKEISDAKGTDPLSKVLFDRKDRFMGILNGIDDSYWNPKSDPYLPLHFSDEKIGDLPPFLQKKGELKKMLRQMLGLEEENSPLVAAIARLTPQKGPHLILQALYRTLERGGQFVFLGSAPEGDTHEFFSNLKRKMEGSKHVHFELTYNEKLSHLVYAASDLFLVPSLFEPCGLTQMIAMRYGTVPLVRSTGGLADTVFDGVNGFTFGPPTLEAIQECIDKALHCWFDEPQRWRDIMEEGMRQDHSWTKAVEDYFTLYEKILDAKHLSLGTR